MIRTLADIILYKLAPDDTDYASRYADVTGAG